MSSDLIFFPKDSAPKADFKAHATERSGRANTSHDGSIKKCQDEPLSGKGDKQESLSPFKEVLEKQTAEVHAPVIGEENNAPDKEEPLALSGLEGDPETDSNVENQLELQSYSPAPDIQAETPVANLVALPHPDAFCENTPEADPATSGMQSTATLPQDISVIAPAEPSGTPPVELPGTDTSAAEPIPDASNDQVDGLATFLTGEAPEMTSSEQKVSRVHHSPDVAELSDQATGLERTIIPADNAEPVKAVSLPASAGGTPAGIVPAEQNAADQETAENGNAGGDSPANRDSMEIPFPSPLSADPAETFSTGGLFNNTASPPTPTTFLEILANTSGETSLTSPAVLAGQLDRLVLKSLDTEGKSMSIELHPASLGKVIVQCRETDSGLAVEINVQGTAIRSILLNQESDLRSSLEAQGMSLAQFSVSCQDRDGRRQAPRHKHDQDEFTNIDKPGTTANETGSHPVYHREGKNQWVA